LHNLIENFALFDTWEDRYRYLIDLGHALPPMDDSLKTESSLVRGCTSRVWLVATRDEAGRFHFLADSDAHIVRGLIAIVLSAYQSKTSAEIQDVDIEQEFSKLGLDQHLSPNRRNGFFAMVERIRAMAHTA
jgi:cysteine desulfuration protein SufE